MERNGEKRERKRIIEEKRNCETGHLPFSPLTVESGPLWETINFCVYPISRAACALLYTNIMPARLVFEISFSEWMLYGKTKKEKKEKKKLDKPADNA